MKKNILLITAAWLIWASEIQAQATTEKQRIEQGVAWLKQVSSVAVEWTNNPEKKAYRQQLQALVKSFGKIKEDITLIYIERQAKAEGIAMIGLLDEVHDAATDILLHLQDDKSLDDPTAVLLSQEEAENRIVPASKKAIEALTGL